MPEPPRGGETISRPLGPCFQIFLSPLAVFFPSLSPALPPGREKRPGAKNEPPQAREQGEAEQGEAEQGEAEQGKVPLRWGRCPSVCQEWGGLCSQVITQLLSAPLPPRVSAHTPSHHSRAAGPC